MYKTIDTSVIESSRDFLELYDDGAAAEERYCVGYSEYMEDDGSYVSWNTQSFSDYGRARDCFEKRQLQDDNGFAPLYNEVEIASVTCIY